MPRDESDRNEFVDVTYDRLVTQTKQAFLVEVDGEEAWVAKSKTHNVDELETKLESPTHARAGSGTIKVPKWLAEENGWDFE